MNFTKIYESHASSNPLPGLVAAFKKRNHEVDNQPTHKTLTFHVYNPHFDWDKAGPGMDDLVEIIWSPDDDELSIEHYHGEHAVDRETVIIDGGMLTPRATADIVNMVERMFRENELK